MRNELVFSPEFSINPPRSKIWKGLTLKVLMNDIGFGSFISRGIQRLAEIKNISMESDMLPLLRVPAKAYKVSAVKGHTDKFFLS